MASREYGGIWPQSMGCIASMPSNRSFICVDGGDASDQDGEMLLPLPHIATLEG